MMSLHSSNHGGAYEPHHYHKSAASLPTSITGPSANACTNSSSAFRLKSTDTDTVGIPEGHVTTTLADPGSPSLGFAEKVKSKNVDEDHHLQSEHDEESKEPPILEERSSAPDNEKQDRKQKSAAKQRKQTKAPQILPPANLKRHRISFKQGEDESHESSSGKKEVESLSSSKQAEDSELPRVTDL